MIIKIALSALFCIYLAINLFTAKLMSAKEMHRDFISGQCTVGKILVNIFYAPAWFLKGLRYVVLALIA